jgi:drug/metabolite transporter (DMT)-like permease
METLMYIAAAAIVFFGVLFIAKRKFKNNDFSLPPIDLNPPVVKPPVVPAPPVKKPVPPEELL